MGLIQQKEKHLTKSEIQKLLPSVNRRDNWQISADSYQIEFSLEILVDKIIKCWFETQGYHFWYNPYPEVLEWKITQENGILFRYDPS